MEEIIPDILVGGLLQSVYSTLIVLATLILFYILVMLFLRKRNIDNRRSILNIIRSLAIILFIFQIISRIVALQSVASTLLASSGIIAIVVGVAAQDTIGNFMSGVSILIFKPFAVGDLVKVNNDALIGFVEEVTLRHTILKTYENNRVIVPNATINKATIENANKIDSLKGNFFVVPITYESDVKKAVEIIENACMQHPHFVDARNEEANKKNVAPVIVRCIDFGKSALILRATVYSKNSFEGFEMLSDLRYTIKELFEQEGIQIAHNSTFK